MRTGRGTGALRVMHKSGSTAMLLLALATGLALSGCGKGHLPAGASQPGPPGSSGKPGPAAATPPGLAGLPTPPLVAPTPVNPRQTSAGAAPLTATEVASHDAGGQTGPGAGGAFAIIPGAQDELGWAVYQVPLNIGEGPTQLSATIQAIIPGAQDELEFWVGAYSFSDQTWEWFGPGGTQAAPWTAAGEISILLNGPHRRSHFADLGNGVNVNTYIAIVTEPQARGGGQGLTVNPGSLAFAVTTDPVFFKTAPLPALVNGAGADTANGKLIVQLDTSQADNPDRIYVERRDRVAAASALRGVSTAGWTALGFVAGSASTFTDPDDVTTGADHPVAGARYEYRITAATVDGTDVLFSAPCAPQLIALTDNQPPLAMLFGDQSTPAAGQAVAFDASQSTDSDGFIQHYEWDFNGDGVYNDSADGEDLAKDNAMPQHSFSGAGVYNVGVRVTDDLGAVDTAHFQVLLHGWAQCVVDGGGAGYYPVLAEVAGNPAVIYAETITPDHYLVYNRCVTSTGTNPNDWGRVVIDQDGFSVDSLAIIDGCPAASFVGTTFDSLKYIRANNATGADITNWPPAITIDSGNTVYGTSLAEINGSPAISYQFGDSQNDQSIRYIRAASADGTSPADWSSVTVDPIDNAGFTCLKLINGNPAISYFDSGNNHLMYVRSASASGMNAGDWNARITVDSGSGSATGTQVGEENSLALIAGNPAIAYIDDATQDLKYVRSTSSTGGSAADWAACFPVVPAASGKRVALFEINGQALAAFTNDALNPATTQSTVLNGSSGWVTGAVSTDSGTSVSAALIGGRPALVYVDSNTHELKFEIYL